MQLTHSRFCIFLTSKPDAWSLNTLNYLNSNVFSFEFQSLNTRLHLCNSSNDDLFTTCWLLRKWLKKTFSFLSIFYIKCDFQSIITLGSPFLSTNGFRIQIGIRVAFLPAGIRNILTPARPRGKTPYLRPRGVPGTHPGKSYCGIYSDSNVIFPK